MLKTFFALTLALTFSSASARNENSGCNFGPQVCNQDFIPYSETRANLFEVVYLEDGANGNYVVDVYCGSRVPMKNDPWKGMAYEGYSMNVEHTWPQSKFSGSYPKELQKSDLHHLFPSGSKINGLRGNLPFGEVNWEQTPAQFCDASKKGRDLASDREVFEPTDEHKGNVARALFYFSVRYQMPIDATQEAYLRKWHQMDPVTDLDRARNEAIYSIQHNRNPFIDRPELVDSINDF